MTSTRHRLISYISAAYRPSIYRGHPWTPVSFSRNDWLCSTSPSRHGALPICHQRTWVCMGSIWTHRRAVLLTSSKCWHLLCRKCIPNAKGNPRYGSRTKNWAISVHKVFGRWVTFYQHLRRTQVPRLYKFFLNLLQWGRHSWCLPPSIQSHARLQW